MSVVKERPANFEELRLESLATVFKALSDVTRLRILQHLTQHESCCKPGEGICACDLEGVTGLSQPTISHHMKTLISADLVASEKSGRWMYYRIDPKGLNHIEAALASLGG